MPDCKLEVLSGKAYVYELLWPADAFHHKMSKGLQVASFLATTS